MIPRSARIAIIGGGLSGLYAAHLLNQRGLTDWVLIEARETLGGRILSLPETPSHARRQDWATTPHDRVDLGPSWFWPDYQLQLDRVVLDLGLERFAQHEEGDMLVERPDLAGPVRTRGFVTEPPSMRLLGGMASLIDALRNRLSPTQWTPGLAVREIRNTPECVALHSEGTGGQRQVWQAQTALLALPPRLAISSIHWNPSLPEPMARQWRDTDTWMAPHAKYVAVYDHPFWRDQGLSGEARSSRGPMGEIHDASMPGGSAALFGFLAVPARARRSVAEDLLRSHCRAQLARLFGTQASTPRAEFLKDWASDPYTATEADCDSLGHHPEPPPTTVPSGPWAGKVIGIGSEWSRQFPGYLAGAIEAASKGVQLVTDGA